jgi:hypothetical protein
LIATLSSVGFALGQESAELQRLRSGYESAVKRVVIPVTETYLQELKRLKETLSRSGKLTEAIQVDEELKAITAKLAGVGAATAPVGSRLGQTIVLSSRATISPNGPDAYKLGPVRPGDVISLKYVEGKWKDHGVSASFSPDDEGIEDTSRLVISQPSKGGVPGQVVAIVPAGTSSKPFTFTVPTAFDQLVLRISNHSDATNNPGQVVYQVKVTR